LVIICDVINKRVAVYEELFLKRLRRRQLTCYNVMVVPDVF